jgi:hypothetical protein
MKLYRDISASRSPTKSKSQIRNFNPIFQQSNEKTQDVKFDSVLTKVEYINLSPTENESPKKCMPNFVEERQSRDDRQIQERRNNFTNQNFNFEQEKKREYSTPSMRLGNNLAGMVKPNFRNGAPEGFQEHVEMQDRRYEMNRSPGRQEFRIASPTQFVQPMYSQYPTYQYPYPYQPMGIPQPFYPPMYNYQMPMGQMGIPNQPVYFVYPQNPRLDTEDIPDEYPTQKNMTLRMEETQKKIQKHNFDAYYMPISSPRRERREPKVEEKYGFTYNQKPEVPVEHKHEFKLEKKFAFEVAKNNQPEIPKLPEKD